MTCARIVLAAQTAVRQLHTSAAAGGGGQVWQQTPTLFAPACVVSAQVVRDVYLCCHLVGPADGLIDRLWVHKSASRSLVQDRRSYR